MPIQVKCGGCETKLNTPDNAAGRKVRCPKCGEAVPIPAAKGTPDKKPSSAPSKLSSALNKPAPKKRAEEDDDEDFDEDESPRKSARKRGDDDEEDEDEDEAPRKSSKKSSGGKKDRAANNEGMVADLPENLAEQVLEQLGGKERILWVGQPNPNLMMIRAIPIIFAGLVFLGLGIFFAVGFKGPGGKTNSEGILGGIGAASLGVLLCTAPIWARKRAHKTAYALTNRRALVWKAGFLFGCKFEEFGAAELTRTKRQNSWFVSGAGDLVFREEVRIHTSTSRDSRGGHHTSTTRQIIQHGFMAIPDVAEVDRLIKREIVEKVNRALDSYEDDD